MNDYFCRKDTMVKLYIKTIFLKDNLIVVLKSLFTRIYWCFVINYRFKIVQIVTLGPMNWPLDQYLTFGPMTSIPDLWTNGVTLEPKAWPSEQWPVFRRTVELWERRRFQRYALDFKGKIWLRIIMLQFVILLRKDHDVL